MINLGREQKYLSFIFFLHFYLLLPTIANLCKGPLSAEAHIKGTH
jgi:hypothetical protein